MSFLRITEESRKSKSAETKIPLHIPSRPLEPQGSKISSSVGSNASWLENTNRIVSGDKNYKINGGTCSSANPSILTSLGSGSDSEGMALDLI